MRPSLRLAGALMIASTSAAAGQSPKHSELFEMFRNRP
jgi:hypothetical protein